MSKLVAIVTGASQGIGRATAVRLAKDFSNGMTVEEATKIFPEEAGISRYGTPEEVADLMAFLVSPAAKWLTGTSVRIDGGEIKGI
jgi:NAD(P)-dependent dehydrogenase (short-subunit alcohol dehydrogenase family)